MRSAPLRNVSRKRGHALDDDAFEPPPDTLSGPTRELVVGTFKLDGRLMLALDVHQAVDTYRATT